MRRVLSLWFPTFSTDLVCRRIFPRTSGSWGRGGARKDRDAGPGAIILTRPVGARELVARRCDCAAAAGVAEGMDLAHARSLLTGELAQSAHIGHHDAAREGAALGALACWAVRFTPLAATDAPDGLILDISGTQALHGGEARLIRKVAMGAGRMGLRVRIAVASTFACARAVARFGEHALSIVPEGADRAREALRDMPLAALSLDDATLHALGEIGLSRIGEVMDLPRKSLPSRFGPLLLERLDMALGERMEHIDPVRPPPPLEASLEFDGPTDRWESLEAAAREVLGALTAQLAARQRGVRKMAMHLSRPHHPPDRAEIHLSQPSRNPRHLWSLIHTRLERVDLGIGLGIDGIRLTALRTGRMKHRQMASPSLGAAGHEDDAGIAWGELIDTLSGRLGAGQVVHMEPVESHLPERAFGVRAAMEGPKRGGEAAGAAISGADRPTRLFSRPEAVRVMALTPDGPVLELEWRDERWPVVACLGPERLGQEWWRWTERPPYATAPPSPPDRDYFAVQVHTGRWLWMFRHVGTTRWFVHGEWA